MWRGSAPRPQRHPRCPVHYLLRPQERSPGDAEEPLPPLPRRLCFLPRPSAQSSCASSLRRHTVAGAVGTGGAAAARGGVCEAACLQRATASSAASRRPPPRRVPRAEPDLDAAGKCEFKQRGQVSPTPTNSHSSTRFRLQRSAGGRRILRLRENSCPAPGRVPGVCRGHAQQRLLERPFATCQVSDGRTDLREDSSCLVLTRKQLQVPRSHRDRSWSMRAGCAVSPRVAGEQVCVCVGGSRFMCSGHTHRCVTRATLPAPARGPALCQRSSKSTSYKRSSRSWLKQNSFPALEKFWGSKNIRVARDDI